jgi:hypothetical protein
MRGVNYTHGIPATCCECAKVENSAVKGRAVKGRKGHTPGTLDHSLLPSVLRQLLPTAFFATTAAMRRPSYIEVRITSNQKQNWNMR